MAHVDEGWLARLASQLYEANRNPIVVPPADVLSDILQVYDIDTKTLRTLADPRA